MINQLNIMMRQFKFFVGLMVMIITKILQLQLEIQGLYINNQEEKMNKGNI